MWWRISNGAIITVPVGGKFCRYVPVFRRQLSVSQLDSGGSNERAGPAGSFQQAGENDQGHLCVSAGEGLPNAFGLGGGCRFGAAGYSRWSGWEKLGETGVWWSAIG